MVTHPAPGPAIALNLPTVDNLDATLTQPQRHKVARPIIPQRQILRHLALEGNHLNRTHAPSVVSEPEKGPPSIDLSRRTHNRVVLVLFEQQKCILDL